MEEEEEEEENLADAKGNKRGRGVLQRLAMYAKSFDRF